MPSAFHYNNYNIGADYETSSKNTLGFAVTGYFNYDNQSNTNNTFISVYNLMVRLIHHYKRFRIIDQSYKDVTIDLNDSYKIDTMGQELSFDA